ncbi:hypothetical protein PQX77_021058 [Marasmius sp. AFHP31]|nr:hypothetical protein PQX77_021058 [Marasmius sp. AFHP31]
MSGKIVGVRPAIAAKYSLNVAPTALIHKKVKGTRSKRPPMTRAERRRQGVQRQTQDAAIKVWMAKLRRLVCEECTQLGKDYKRKPRYFTDMFFQGGARIRKPANKPSSFNAFISKKSREARAAGSPMTLRQIQEEFTNEYKALTPEERNDIVASFEQTRDLDTRERLKRPSVQEKMVNVASSFTQIAGILKGLKIRVGIEAVVLAVKNRPEKIMAPKWIFTDDRIRHYLPTIVRGWNTATVGKKIEALAVAGCDPTKLIKNLAEQTDTLKKELAQLIQEALDEACSTTNQAMQYERFDTLITLQYGVVCEGWPKGLPFQKPSAFGGNNESLSQLRDAWRDGVAVFRRLNNEELAAWRAARSKSIKDGTIVLKSRKKRRDAGTKRGPKGKGKGKEKTVESGDEDSQEEASSEESDEGGTLGNTPSNASVVAKEKPAKPAPKKKTSTQNDKTTKVSTNAPNTHGTPPHSPLPPQSAAACPPIISPPIDPPRPKPKRIISERERASLQQPSKASIIPISQDAGSDGSTLDKSLSRDRSSSDDMLIDPQLRSLDPVDESPSDPVAPADPAPVTDSLSVPVTDSLPAASAGSTIAIADNSGKKRKAPVAQDSQATVTERPKRARTATKRKHLGASTHPALRGLTKTSGEDSDS